MRVTAGAFSGVVETTPRSVKIAVVRAPASSMASTSRRRETPVVLRPSTVSPEWLRLAHQRAGRGRLAAVHARADQCHDRHALGVQESREVQRLAADPRRHADPLAQVGEVEHRPQHLALERRPQVRVHRVADAHHSAHVEQVTVSPGASRSGRWPE